MIHLSLCTRSVVHLIEVIKHTPNIQHLSVTIGSYYDKNYLCLENELASLEEFISSFRYLTALQYLSICAMLVNISSSNDYNFAHNNARPLFD